MRKLILGGVVVSLAVWAAACSSASDVRSGSGPSTTAKAATEEAVAADVSDGEEPESATATSFSGPKDSPYLFVQGTVAVPAGDPGALAVVFIGSPDDTGESVPVIVRNNTDKAVGGIEVNGTARAADGSLVGSGSSQGFTPSVLQPGEWGFGYVYFGSALPADASIETTARGDHSDDWDLFAKVQLKVNELNRLPGEFGSASYVGIVSNDDSDETATDPVSVNIGCFDAESNLVTQFSGYADGEVVPGGTASFSLSVYDAPECAAVVVGASGHSF